MPYEWVAAVHKETSFGGPFTLFPSGLERQSLPPDDLSCVEHVGIEMGVSPMPPMPPPEQETGVRPVPPSMSASKLKMPLDGVLMEMPVASVRLIRPDVDEAEVVTVVGGSCCC